jgi:hypothetical protein
MEDAPFRRGANKDVSHLAESARISIPKEFRVDCRRPWNDSCYEIRRFSEVIRGWEGFMQSQVSKS